MYASNSKPDSDRSPSGVIGCVDPSGACLRTLADWAAPLAAEVLCRDGDFQLWGWADRKRHRHPVHSSLLCGLLVGDLYEIPETAAAVGATVAESYHRDGASCLFRLIGQLAAFLWDRDRRELLLFRDDSGAGSVYYRQLPSGAVVFSDRLELLITSPLVEKRLSRRSLHEFLRFLDVSAPNTIYDGVLSTEPGVLLRFRSGGLRQQGKQPAPVIPPPRTLAAAADELERRLTAAVSARISPGGTTVVFLSGGVDSSLICSLAATRNDTRVEALTVGFAEAELDESIAARRIAEHLGVAHQVLTFSTSTYREAFDRLTAGMCCPFADPAGVPTLLAFQAARERGTTALDGTGADTLCGVMPARHQRFAIEFGTLLPGPLRRLTARALRALPGLKGYAPLVDFDDPEEILIRWRGWPRRELEHLCGEQVSLAHTKFYRLFRQFPRNAHLERYSALLGHLPDDRIHQASVLTGLDVRFPYSDPAVTAWVQGLELNLRHQPAEPKRVLKSVLGRYVPRPLWDSPKHGFDFPFLGLLVDEDYALVRQYLDPALTGRWGLFDQNRIDLAVDRFIHGRWRNPFEKHSPAFRVWALVVLFAWLENHYRGL